MTRTANRSNGRRFWRRKSLIRVCVNDNPVYAKTFRASSTRDALRQASLDIASNRDWRDDWEIIGGGVTIQPDATLVTANEEGRS